MSPEKQRIAIAEACGWLITDDGSNNCKIMGSRHGWKQGFKPEPIPDYLHDLNPMHEAEKVLDKMPDIHEPGVGICTGNEVYEDMLLGVCDHPIRATAAQRCEAFLKTINKWINDN